MHKTKIWCAHVFREVCTRLCTCCAHKMHTKWIFGQINIKLSQKRAVDNAGQKQKSCKNG